MVYKRGSIVLLLSLFMSACSYSTYFVPKQTKVYAPSDPASIAISPQQDLGAAYERVGRVATIVWGTGDEARMALQEQASKMGANAIIDFRLERGFSRTAASGLAIRVFSRK